MSIDVQTCDACAATWFPHRLMCPRCGAGELVTRAADLGVLEESTTLRDGVHVGTVRLVAGPRVIARLSGAISSGDAVPLTHDPLDPRRPVAYVPAGSHDERNLHG